MRDGLALMLVLAAGNGWHTKAGTSGGLWIAEATTSMYHEPEGVFPDKTFRALPRDGILIAAWDDGRSRPRLLTRPRRMPYRLVEFRHDRRCAVCAPRRRRS
jgi:hypothetical protein